MSSTQDSVQLGGGYVLRRITRVMVRPHTNPSNGMISETFVRRQICRNKLAREKYLMRQISEKYPERNAKVLKQKMEEAKARQEAERAKSE